VDVTVIFDEQGFFLLRHCRLIFFFGLKHISSVDWPKLRTFFRFRQNFPKFVAKKKAFHQNFFVIGSQS